MRFVNPFVLCAALFAAACGADPAADTEQTNSLLKTQVVCRTCPPALLQSATDEILAVMNDFVAFAGADMRDIQHHTYQPVIHLDNDETCDPDNRTELGTVIPPPFGHHCLYLNADRQQGTYPPFAETSAIGPDVLRDQAFDVAQEHWLYNRFNYFSNFQAISWAAKLMLLEGVADVCDPVQRDWQGFIPALCGLGLKPQMIPAIYKGLAELTERINRERPGYLPGHDDFVELISRILGTDAEPAFEKAQIPDY